MKLLFAKLTLLIALLSFITAILYFYQKYALGHALPLGTLVALAITLATAIFLYVLSFLLIPFLPIFKNIKKIFSKQNRAKQINIDKTQQKLAKMIHEQGTATEILLILPPDLSFLLAKESIKNLFWGKIKEENEETGIIVGSAGFGSSPQEIRLSVQSIMQHSSKINIISKSSKKRQSNIKNSRYIKKINNFLRDKEKFYTE